MLVVPSSDFGPEIGLPNCWSVQRRSHVPTEKRWKISKIRLNPPPSTSFPIHCPPIIDIRRSTIWDITSSFHKPEIKKKQARNKKKVTFRVQLGQLYYGRNIWGDSRYSDWARDQVTDESCIDYRQEQEIFILSTDSRSPCRPFSLLFDG